MKPVFTAKKMFEGHDERFIDVLDDHLTSGWVYSGDDCFVMAKTISSTLLESCLNKPLDTDMWFIYIYAGNLKRVLELIPFEKEYVGFRRNNGAVKVYSMKRLLAKLRR
jgi:hypothetical protein